MRSVAVAVRPAAALPARADLPLRFALEGGVAVEVLVVGAAPAPADRADDIAVYERALGAADLVRVPLAHGVEEFLVVRDLGSAPELALDLRVEGAVDGVRVRDGRVEIHRLGKVLLASDPMWALDARGTKRAIVPAVTALAEGVVRVNIPLDLAGMAAPVLVDPAWTTAPSMSVPRTDFSLVRLTDGRVLAAGAGLGVSTSEIYDPVANTWTVTGSMTAGRVNVIGTLLPSGKVMVIGDSNKVERFDPATGVFTLRTSAPITGSTIVGMHTVGTKVVVLQSDAGANVYDEATDSWSGPFAQAKARFYQNSAAVGGKVYIAGGITIDGQSVADVDAFDPVAKTWTSLPPVAAPRLWAALSAVGGGRLILAGGRTVLGTAPSDAELFDPALGTWTVVSSAPAFFTTYATGFVMPSGNAIFGGAAPSNPPLQFVPATGAWARVTTALTTRDPASTRSVLLATGALLQCGGRNAASVPLASCDRLDLLVDGTTCTANPGDCASGICTDGVCCDAPCTATCTKCNAAGTLGKCTALDGVAPKTSLACAPYTTCKAGACSTTCTTDTACTAGSYCAAGTCKLKRANGDACLSFAECISGNCVDKVCCNSGCTGQCEACAQPGKEGKCSAVTGAPASGRTACDGAGAGTACGKVCDGTTRATCVYLGAGKSPCGKNACVGGVETHASTCDGAGACADKPVSCGDYVCGALVCKTDCGSKFDCAAGFLCTTGKCVPAPGLGEPCKDGSECSTGFCVDGVCCGKPTCGAGSTCATVGKLGVCTKLAGIACAADDECAGKHCVDGVCCDTACTGQCEACDLAGQVGKCAPTLGAPRGARSACATGADACLTRTCDGTTRDACAGFATTVVECRKAGCKASIATRAATCDGKGACPAAVTESCGAYACDADGLTCRTFCSVDADCADGNTCRGGVCAPKVARCTADYSGRISPDGVTTPCGAFRCRAGECPTKCATSDDCALGKACADGACVDPTATADSGGGCTFGGGSRGGPWALAALVFGVVALGRRRKQALAAALALSATGCGTTREPVSDPPLPVLPTLQLDRVGTGRAHQRLTAPVERLELPEVSGAPLRLSSQGLFVEVSPLGLRPVRARREGAFQRHLGVADGMDLLHRATGDGVEELRVLADPSAPHVARYRLVASKELVTARVGVGPRIELLDAAGHVRVESGRLVAIDAGGREHLLTASVARDGEAFSLRVALEPLAASDYPVVVDPSWSVVAATPYSWSAPRVAALPSGDLLITAYESASFLPNSARFRAVTSTFAKDSTAPAASRDGATLTALPSGLLLQAGGVSIPSADLYDGSTFPGTWSAAAKPAKERNQHGAALLASPSAGVVVFGGWSGTTGLVSATAERFDAASKTWSTLPSMATARHSMGWAVLPSGKLLVMGGASDLSLTHLSSSEIYDPVANAWAPAAPMAVGRVKMGFLLVAGKVLVVGDNGAGLSSAELFDPATNTWAALPAMKDRRGQPAMALLPSGRALIAGGGYGTIATSAAEVFDPVSKTFLAAGNMRRERSRGATAFAMPSGKVLVLGGASEVDGDYLFDAEWFEEQPNGSACTGPGECSSGICVDGVCCDKACNGECQACAEAGKVGTCSPVSGPPRKAHPACAPYATCSAGVCASSCAKDDDCCGSSAACCTDAVCTGFSPTYCATTTCVAKLAKGQVCTRDAMCATGHCADGVCCDLACDGQCEACAEPSSVGTCLAIKGAARGSRTACTTTPLDACSLQCDGVDRKSCQFPTTVTPCAKSECPGGIETHASVCDGIGHCSDVPKACGAYACAGTACAKTCAGLSDCAAGFVCKAPKCVPAPGLGQICSATAPCSGSLSCTDGVCCGVSACGPSESCNSPARAGTCAKINGAACTSEAECGSGVCVDGVCCESACTGQCQACDVAGSLGKCVAIKGAPHGTRLACGKGASTCEATSCDGAEASRCAALAGADTACRPAACAAGIAVSAASCDGKGACPAETRTPCAPFRCAADKVACATSCTATADCATGFVCKAGKCEKGASHCSADGLSLLDPLDNATSCAPFRCKAAACLDTCTTSDDCVPGTACASGRCDTATAPTETVPDSGGCAMGARGGALPMFGLVLALGGLLRRQNRASRSR